MIKISMYLICIIIMNFISHRSMQEAYKTMCLKTTIKETIRRQVLMCLGVFMEKAFSA